MDSEYRNQIVQKRAQLQLRIRFDDFFKTYVEPFTEILDELLHTQIKYHIVSLRFVPSEFQSLFMEKFQKEPFAKYSLSRVETVMGEKVMESLIDVFPNKHSSRYFPDLSVVGSFTDLISVLTELIHEHDVYICWIQYPFLLEIDFQDLVQKIKEESLDCWFEDAVIFPKDYSWVIVYHAVEDEWLFGKR